MLPERLVNDSGRAEARPYGDMNPHHNALKRSNLMPIGQARPLHKYVLR